MEVIERPVLFCAAGEGVDDCEVFDGLLGHGDSRFADAVDGERGKEREGEMADCFPEFRLLGSVPGVDGVEGFEVGERAWMAGDADEVEARVGDGSGVIGELDYREDGAWGPDFGVVGCAGGAAIRLEFREGEDAIADGAGADEESTHFSRIAAASVI